jgi:hypothetical protein
VRGYLGLQWSRKQTSLATAGYFGDVPKAEVRLLSSPHFDFQVVVC